MKRFNDYKEDIRHRLLFKKKALTLAKLAGRRRLIVLASDCVGGRLMKDYELPCWTPLVNMYIPGGDFLKICNNPELYFTSELENFSTDEEGHPIGKCRDALIYFGHSFSFQESLKQWTSGCRLFMSSLKKDHDFLILMNDRNGFEDEMVADFERLPYENKVLFTHKYHKDSPFLFNMHEENLPFVRTITDFENKLSLKRRYDRYDFFTLIKNIYKK